VQCVSLSLANSVGKGHLCVAGITYSTKAGFLLRRLTTTPATDAQLTRIIVGHKNTTSDLLANKIKYGEYYNDLYATTQYVWKSGHSFFDTTTENLRRMQGPARTSMHKSVTRWTEHSPQQLDTARLWKETLVPYRSARKNCFLWQMINILCLSYAV
jgi:hypothetical protein